MTMTFSLHENIEFTETARQFETSSWTPEKSGKTTAEHVYLFAEKLRIPEFKKSLPRPRLNELLAKSSRQFGATLICGRAGTGKTALAANFAASYDSVAWFSVDSTDADWDNFSKYLRASIFGSQVDFGADENSDSVQTKIAGFFNDLFARIVEKQHGKPLLIVLDDIHHIFDADWFDDFFNLFLYSLVPNVHLLLLCRSKPSYPLWRLRSKQVLNVIDEKLLALNVEETEELYKNYGLARENARKAHRDCFGRISKLMLSIDSALAK
jgi:LuxR family transcriptional regulator, maltose regulon positive regulatory protein